MEMGELEVGEQVKGRAVKHSIAVPFRTYSVAVRVRNAFWQRFALWHRFALSFVIPSYHVPVTSNLS
jgi:hypothetical protein